METLTLDGRRFHFLGEQRGGARVYRGEDAYLRIGPYEAIERDLGLHRAMEKAKYPVAKIIDDGELYEQRYFIESAVGDRSFRAIFQDDSDSAHGVTDDHFREFLELMKKLYTAQKRAAKGAWDTDEFAAGIRLPELCRELPVHAPAIRARFEKAISRIAALPRTITHGDCNPANMYHGGIIDLEDSFYGPLGYDVVSALMTIEWSPELRSYEFYAQYRFTEKQTQKYKAAFRGIAPHFDDFAFCRAVWLCSGMRKWPRIQQWRFEKFIHEYLS
ncbi:MAG TPA: aminoglycoside phosphotransferase family protein [Candidatus Paceibacterota bacterium]|nr:aminoglycoside phosphotransferase family protein [Candidatus Paceibacterota bacterium]